MKSRSKLKTLAQLLIFGSIFFQAIFLNISTAQASILTCGKPDYDRAKDRGIYIWRNCGTQIWSFRVSSGGRPVGDEYRVSGRLQLNKPFAFLDGFSIDPGLSGSQDLFDTSDPNKVDFIFRVWADSQDGFDFRLQNNTNACLSIGHANISTPVVIGDSNLARFAPVNLVTLDSANCVDISSLNLLLME